MVDTALLGMWEGVSFIKYRSGFHFLVNGGPLMRLVSMICTGNNFLFDIVLQIGWRNVPPNVLEAYLISKEHTK